VLLHGNAERNQFSNLLTQILPGRTRVEIKWSLPSKDCNSFKEAFFFLNQEIFKILSTVTSKVNFSESNNTPKNIILLVVGRCNFLQTEYFLWA
jgi:hypothetical protein